MLSEVELVRAKNPISVVEDLSSASSDRPPWSLGRSILSIFLSKLHKMLRFATCVYCFCCLNMDKVPEMTLCICYRDIAPMLHISWYVGWSS
jgi:hypothetical protein